MYLCSVYVIVLYAQYYNEEAQHVLDAAEGVEEGESWRVAKRNTFFLGLAYVLIIGVAGVIALFSTGSADYAWGLAIVGSFITSVHWLPQIRETWRLRGLGSLSFWMLFIQSGGCILTFFNVKSGGLIVGVPFLLASFMMGILLCMAGWFRLVDGREEEPVPTRELEREKKEGCPLRDGLLGS